MRWMYCLGHLLTLLRCALRALVVPATTADRQRDVEAGLTTSERIERKPVAMTGCCPRHPEPVADCDWLDFPADGLCCTNPERLADMCLHGGYGPQPECTFVPGPQPAPVEPIDIGDLTDAQAARIVAGLNRPEPAPVAPYETDAPPLPGVGIWPRQQADDRAPELGPQPERAVWPEVGGDFGQARYPRWQR